MPIAITKLKLGAIPLMLLIGLLVFIFSLTAVLVNRSADALSLEVKVLNQGEVFVQEDNSYRGGVILKLDSQVFKIIHVNVTSLEIKIKPVKFQSGLTNHNEQLFTETGTYNKFILASDSSPNSSLPMPGVYIKTYGPNSDSYDIIGVTYDGLMLEGLKLTGGRHVPLGEKTIMMDLSLDPVDVKVHYANIGFKNSRWDSDDYRLHSFDHRSFGIEYNYGSRRKDRQFLHISMFVCKIID